MLHTLQIVSIFLLSPGASEGEVGEVGGVVEEVEGAGKRREEEVGEGAGEALEDLEIGSRMGEGE